MIRNTLVAHRVRQQLSFAIKSSFIALIEMEHEYICDDTRQYALALPSPDKMRGFEQIH
jgi:hypothetical protein